MTIGLTDEHLALRDSVRGWANRHVTADVRREAVEAKTEQLPPYWTSLAEQGLLGLHLPEDEAYDTIAGLLVRQLGRIPVRGDSAMLPLPVEIPEDDDEDPVQEYAVMRVERMDGLRVDRISLKLLTEDASGSDTGADGGETR